jgi:hypothetical protein
LYPRKRRACTKFSTVTQACKTLGKLPREQAWGQAILGRKHPVAPGSGWGDADVKDVLAVLDGALAKFSFCDAD